MSKKNRISKIINGVTFTLSLILILTFQSCDNDESILEVGSESINTDYSSERVQNILESKGINLNDGNYNVKNVYELEKEEEARLKATASEVTGLDFDPPQELLEDFTFDNAKDIGFLNSTMNSADYSNEDVIKLAQPAIWDDFIDFIYPDYNQGKNRMKSFGYKAFLDDGSSSRYLGIIGATSGDGSNISYSSITAPIRIKYTFNSSISSVSETNLSSEYIGPEINVPNDTQTPETAANIMYPANLLTINHTRLSGTSTSVANTSGGHWSAGVSVAVQAGVPGDNVTGTFSFEAGNNWSTTTTTGSVTSDEESNTYEIGYGQITVPSKGYCNFTPVAKRKQFTYNNNYDIEVQGDIAFRYLETDYIINSRDDYDTRILAASGTDVFFDYLAKDINRNVNFSYRTSYLPSYKCYLDTDGGDILLKQKNVIGEADIDREIYVIDNIPANTPEYIMTFGHDKWLDYFDGVKFEASWIQKNSAYGNDYIFVIFEDENGYWAYDEINVYDDPQLSNPSFEMNFPINSLWVDNGFNFKKVRKLIILTHPDDTLNFTVSTYNN